MGVVAVFLDGGYLDKLMALDHGNARIDYAKLAAEMAAPDELLRCYYYHCLPYQSNPATAEEKQRYSGKQRFFRALAYLERFEVRLGRLAFRGTDMNGQKIFEQKRVDNMIGVDMALLAGKAKITRVALLSGDSDYIPSIEAVKREAVTATLWHGSFNGKAPPSRELFEICDVRKELNSAIVAKIVRC